MLPQCWEIKKCGREKGGAKAQELGECQAAQQGLGHSCWAVAGTLCGGEVQGTMAQKEGNCMLCDVYKRYHRQTGSDGLQVVAECPDEQVRYQALMQGRLAAKH